MPSLENWEWGLKIFDGAPTLTIVSSPDHRKEGWSGKEPIQQLSPLQKYCSPIRLPNVIILTFHDVIALAPAHKDSQTEIRRPLLWP